MDIEVQIPTILRPLTGDERSVKGSGGTLAELLDDLDSRHSGIKAKIVEDDKVRRFVNVYVNDEDVRFLDGLQTQLSAGDRVQFLPAVAGG